MRRLAAALPVVAAALLLSGCGSDAAGSTGEASPAAAAGAGNTDFAAYRQCLSEHGVTLPEGGPGGGMGDGTRPSGRPTDLPSGMPTDRPSGAPTDLPSGGPGAGGRGNGGGGFGMRVPDGVDEDAWKAAQEACASLAPARPNRGQGAPGGSGGGQSGSTPTSTPSSAASTYAVFWQCMSDHDVTAPASGDPKDLDTSDATVAAALKTCDALLPSGS